MRTVTYQTLLKDFAGAARKLQSDLTADERERMTADLNAAALWLWETECSSSMLPDMATGKSVTLSTGGIIPAATIENATFWSIWQRDPRAEPEHERNKLKLGATALGNGDVKLTPGTSAATVYVIYKSIPPQWTVDAPDLSRNYAIGDRVLSNGRVYRAIIADASAADLTDTTTWVEVTLPQSLQRIVTLKANFERLRLGANLPAAASREDAELERALDLAWIASENQPGNKPWLHNQNA